METCFQMVTSSRQYTGSSLYADLQPNRSVSFLFSFLFFFSPHFHPRITELGVSQCSPCLNQRENPQLPVVPGHLGKKRTKGNHKVLSHLRKRREGANGDRYAWTKITFRVHSWPDKEAGCGLEASQRIECPSSKWPSQLCISIPFSHPE